MSSQRIRFLRASDGVRLAWAEAGTGPTLVKAANWLSHLEYEWESPVWRHWIRFLSGHFRFVRYDERGCGMTDWNTGDLSFEQQIADLHGPGGRTRNAGGSCVCCPLGARARDPGAHCGGPRERAEIAERLSIGDKTVRNHVSNVFDKLGVWTRAQAIVFAHDHGFK